MHNTNYKNWLKEMEDVSKDDILKFYYNLYFKCEKQKEVLDKIKEKLNTKLAFTSSYQLNYQSAMCIIEQAKEILEEIE